MTREIDYGNLMHEAMRGLIRRVLADVAANGLPGAHHFFITFDTRHPGVKLVGWLAERYPNDMTIVLQHWFEDLEVDDDGFAVTLNFGDSPERLRVPFDAIRTFVDPSVEFGLRFEATDDEEGPSDEDPLVDLDRTDAGEAPAARPAERPAARPTGRPAEHPAARSDAEIVPLDKFRK